MKKISFYVLIIFMAFMQRAKIAVARKPVVVAHRGAPGLAVENTEESFRRAVDLGADVLETDVRLTSDGHLLLSHDSSLERLGGPSESISALSRKEIELIMLQQAGNYSHPLFMDEALAAFPEQNFCVELKDKGYSIVKKWCSLLEESGAGQRCITASFWENNLRIFRSLNTTSPVSISRKGVLGLIATSFFSYARQPSKQEGIIHIPQSHMGLRIVSPARVKLWQKRGWEIVVWTVDDEMDMRRLLEWGVNGIITNKPGLARSVIAQFEE